MLDKLKLFVAQKRIPKNTVYCYDVIKCREKYRKLFWEYSIKPCPYWKKLREKDEQDNPKYYCKFLKLKGEYQGDNLLWDMCKECGINDDLE